MTTQRSSFEYLTCFALSKILFYLIFHHLNASLSLPFQRYYLIWYFIISIPHLLCPFKDIILSHNLSSQYLTCFALSKFSFYLIIYQFNALFDLPFCCLFQPSIFCPNCFFFKIKESFCLASWLECSVELCLQQVGASLHFKQAVKWNRARLTCSCTSFNSFFWSFSIP